MTPAPQAIEQLKILNVIETGGLIPCGIKRPATFAGRRTNSG
jgi:hypothetical protein